MNEYLSEFQNSSKSFIDEFRKIGNNSRDFEVQNATSIVITKLDVLSYMDKIPVCIRYELDGKNHKLKYNTAEGVFENE